MYACHTAILIHMSIVYKPCTKEQAPRFIYSICPLSYACSSLTFCFMLKVCLVIPCESIMQGFHRRRKEGLVDTLKAHIFNYICWQLYSHKSSCYILPVFGTIVDVVYSGYTMHRPHVFQTCLRVVKEKLVLSPI